MMPTWPVSRNRTYWQRQPTSSSTSVEVCPHRRAPAKLRAVAVPALITGPSGFRANHVLPHNRQPIARGQFQPQWYGVNFKSGLRTLLKKLPAIFTLFRPVDLDIQSAWRHPIKFESTLEYPLLSFTYPDRLFQYNAAHFFLNKFLSQIFQPISC